MNHIKGIYMQGGTIQGETIIGGGRVTVYTDGAAPSRRTSGPQSLGPAQQWRKGDRPLTFFIAYAEADQEMHGALCDHLSVICATHDLRLASPADLLPGSEPRAALDQMARDADLVLALVSASLLASKMILSLLGDACERSMDIPVVPILIKECHGWETPFSQQQVVCLPRRGGAVASWRNQDEAWTDVISGIVSIVGARASRAGQAPPASRTRRA